MLDLRPATLDDAAAAAELLGARELAEIHDESCRHSERAGLRATHRNDVPEKPL